MALPKVTVAESTTRSELALAPEIPPVTSKEPCAKVSTVPFLLRAPESVRVPAPVLRKKPVPLMTEISRSKLVEAAPV